MDRKKKIKPPTIEERIVLDVSTLLDAKIITPAMIYAIILDGYRAYKSGNGELTWMDIWVNFQ